MRKIKKRLRWAIVVIAVFMLLGCSKTDQKNGKIVLSYGIWDMNQEFYIKKLINKFEQENPNIEVKINLTPWGQYWTKLEAASTGGVEPDVFWMGMERGIIYSIAGIAQPLDKYIKQSKINMKNYVGTGLSAYTVNGKLYAMPRDVDSIGLWYNKKLFNEAGVKYPTNNWTWNDMLKAAAEIKNNLKGVVPIAMDLSAQNSYDNFIYQSGGYVISDDLKKSGFDNPNSIKAIKLMMNCINKGYMPPKNQLSDFDAVAQFQSNRVAMYFAGSWMAGPFTKNKIINNHIGVVVMPLIKVRKAISHSVGIMMSSNTKHPQAAWKFIKFMTSFYAQKYLADHQVIIPALKSAQKYWAESFKNIDVTPFIMELKYAVPLPHSRETIRWMDAAQQTLKQVWVGNLSPKKGCDKIATEMNEDLERE